MLLGHFISLKYTFVLLKRMVFSSLGPIIEQWFRPGLLIKPGLKLCKNRGFLNDGFFEEWFKSKPGPNRGQYINLALLSFCCGFSFV